MATAGFCAPAAVSVAMPGSAGTLLDVRYLRLSKHGRASGARVLLGARTLPTISTLLTLRGGRKTGSDNSRTDGREGFLDRTARRAERHGIGFPHPQPAADPGLPSAHE